MNDAPTELRTDCEGELCMRAKLPIWHCVDCDSTYCSRCWPLQGPHRPYKRGRDGVPHEKVDVRVVQRLREILSPSSNVQDIQRKHEADKNTKWFGVVRDSSGRPLFEEYGRYTTLMSGNDPVSRNSKQFPQLVSFIGVTSAGKSSLINMLIHHESGDDTATTFPAPVVGSKLHDSVPTSGDVHLYADPSTYSHSLPILYADCEGFEGGERLPLGSQSWNRSHGQPGRGKIERDISAQIRPIQWASTEDSRRREYAVTALYPRLLYTFSDCVVFVLRNPRTFQSAVLTKLLDWGAAAMEKSINQATLPHCIVVLNGSDLAIRNQEWNVDYATQSLLSTVLGALDFVEGVPRFRELADYWRRLGSHIGTVEDLILRYYSSFKVVRIPVQPHYMAINEQIGKLHGTIRDACGRSYRAKHRARMLTDADELDTYLQSGFDHFTTHLDVPFNFMHASLVRNPIPDDFGGHILRLCTTLSARFPTRRHDTVRWMFEKLSTVLASCVLLDCARFRKGRINELFSSYERFFDYAMGEYLELHSPCSFTSVDGARIRTCGVVKARHDAKGHQDNFGIIAAGDYVAVVDRDFAQQWKQQLRTAIDVLYRDFSFELDQVAQSSGDLGIVSQDRIALNLHLENIDRFYQAVGPATMVVSHATCFSCLMHTPEHPLPCGHVLCHECVLMNGKPWKGHVSMTCCPMHPDNSLWDKPMIVRLRPPGSGIRVLTLDGGGIRGVVQLEILLAIERAMGSYMPVQRFFDLVVGTGTGGLIATALSTAGNTTEHAREIFLTVCEHAYSPKLAGMAFIGQLIHLFGPGPKHRAEPFYTALKTQLGGQRDFFGPGGQFSPNSRVAVTSIGPAQGELILHANYRRPHDSSAPYVLHRPHDPVDELKTWECVCAAMSNPVYFKPFKFKNKTFLDGSLRYSNPAEVADREAKCIWPGLEQYDIFLSLGTGQDRTAIVEKLSSRPRASGASGPGKGDDGKVDEVLRAVRRLRGGKVEDVLGAELAWHSLKAVTVQERSENHGKRLIRLNPDLGKQIPAQDTPSQLKTLQTLVQQILNEPHRIAAVRNIANRLIASSFYFSVYSQTIGDKGDNTIRGAIVCRFDDGSAEMVALGKTLSKRLTDDFQPFFLVLPFSGSIDMSHRITLTKQKLSRMIDSAVFEQPEVLLRLDDETRPSSIHLFLSSDDRLEPEGFPISGFPRVLSLHGRSHGRFSSFDTRSRPGFRSRDTMQNSLTHSERILSRHPARRSIESMRRWSDGLCSSSPDSSLVPSPPWENPYHNISKDTWEATMDMPSHFRLPNLEPKVLKPSQRCSERRISRMSLDQEWHHSGAQMPQSETDSYDDSLASACQFPGDISASCPPEDRSDGPDESDIPQPLNIWTRSKTVSNSGALLNGYISPTRTLFEEQQPDAANLPLSESDSVMDCMAPDSKVFTLDTDESTLYTPTEL